jgi:hypothetical protein
MRKEFLEGESKVLLVHALKASRSGGISPLILNHLTAWSYYNLKPYSVIGPTD